MKLRYYALVSFLMVLLVLSFTARPSSATGTGDDDDSGAQATPVATLEPTEEPTTEPTAEPTEEPETPAPTTTPPPVDGCGIDCPVPPTEEPETPEPTTPDPTAPPVVVPPTTTPVPTEEPDDEENDYCVADEGEPSDDGVVVFVPFTGTEDEAAEFPFFLENDGSGCPEGLYELVIVDGEVAGVEPFEEVPVEEVPIVEQPEEVEPVVRVVVVREVEEVEEVPVVQGLPSTGSGSTAHMQD